MSAFSLDDIRAAAEKKYASTDITLDNGSVVKLLNVMRLPETKRDQLRAMQAEMNAMVEDETKTEADQKGLLEECLVLVAETDPKGKALVKALGGDIALLMEVFLAYVGGTELGEASASAA